MHGDEGTTVLTTEEALYRSIEHFVATAGYHAVLEALVRACAAFAGHEALVHPTPPAPWVERVLALQQLAWEDQCWHAGRP